MTEVARAEIYVDVNDREAIASLHRLDEQFEKDMRRMDGREAEVRIKGNLTDLKRALKEADAAIKAQQKAIASREKEYLDETSRGKRSALRKDINARKQEIVAIEQAVAATRKQGVAAEAHYETLVRTNKERDYAAKKEAAQAKLEKDRAKVAERSAKEKARQDAAFERERQQNAENYRKLVDRTAKEQADAAERNRKADADFHRDRMRNMEQTARLREQAVTQQQREERAVHKTELAVRKMEQAYLKARQRRDQADRDLRKISTRLSPATHQRIEVERATAIAQMVELKAEMNALGRNPPVKIHTEVDDHNNILTRWLKGMTEATVRIGPFTTTIAGLAKSLLLLGPIIMGLVGTLGALTGALGAGLVGALGLATAGMAGFSMAMLGMFTIIKPLIGDFNDARKASNAYDKAVREHGKGSEEAAKKLEILNNVLGDVPKRTREQFIEMGRLSDRWKRLTQDARPEFWKTVGDGIQTVTDLMPMFARHSTDAFTAVSRGMREWMRGIRSGEGQALISKIFGNFNAMLPSLMRGLGNLGGAIGHVAASFSRFLPGMGRSFEQWSQGLLDASRNTVGLNASADKLVGSLRSVWDFTKAATRVFYEFFRAAAGPGAGLFNDMAGGLNRLADSMGTVSGQAKLHEFFQQSIETAKQLWGAIAPLLKLFIEFTTIMRPITNIALEVTGALASLAHTIASFGPVKALLQAAFAIFLTRALVGRVRAVGEAITGLLGRFAALRTAQAAAAGASGLTLFGPGNAGAGDPFENKAKGAERAATRMGRAGQSFGKAARMAGTFGTALTGIPAPLLAIGAGLAVAVGGLALLDNALNPTNKKLQELADRADAGTQGMVNSNQRFMAARDTLNQYGTEVVRTRMSLKDARAELAKTTRGTDAHRSALLNVREAMRAHIQANMDLKKGEQDYNNAARTGIKNALARKNANDKLITSLREQLKESRGTPFEKVVAKSLETAQNRTGQFAEAVQSAWNRVAVAPIAAQRAIRGMIALTGQAEQSIGSLARKAGGKKIATTIGIKYEDPNKAGRVAAAAKKALDQGVGRGAVMRIVANTNSADAAIRRLNRTRLNDVEFKVKAMTDSALLALAGVNDKKVRDKVLNILGNSRLAKRAHQVIDNLPNINKTLSMLGKNQAAKRAHAAIASMPNITKILTVTANTGAAKTALDAMASIKLPPLYQDVYPRRHKATGGFAAGSGNEPSGAQPNKWQIARAGATADMAGSPRKARSQKVTGPQYLVGEEGRPEIVVSTNPAYRKRNRKYAAMAARAVGLDVISAATGYAPGDEDTGFVGTGPFADAGNLGSFRLRQDAKPPKTPGDLGSIKAKKGHPRRVAIAKKSNAWNTWIGKMRKGQGMLEREVGLQEANLDPPDSFLRKNPETGEEEVDIGKRDKYANKLENLREWYDTLLNWIRTEADNLKTAMEVFKAQVQAGQAEKEEATRTVKHYQKKINKERDKETPKYTSGKHKGKVNKPAAQARKKKIRGWEDIVDKFRKRGTAASGWITDGRSRAADVDQRTAEIGYNFRETRNTRNDWEQERADLTETAAQQLKDFNESNSSDSGGGGGGSDLNETPQGIAYQGALVDTERANILREFGGNANPNVGGVSGPSAPGVLSGSTKGGQSASGAVAAALASGSVSSGGAAGVINTLAGGAAAGSAMAGLASGASTGVVAGVAGVAGGGATTLNVTNNFKYQPADPHTWSQGVAFELGAAL